MKIAELILELKRKREDEINYQMLQPTDKLYYTAEELTEKALDISYSDGKIQQIDDIIFFLESYLTDGIGLWEDEIETEIKRN